MKELFINNEPVDIGEASFKLNFQIGKIGEFKPVGGGSYTINIPITAHNTELFERCNIQPANSSFPYKMHGVRYYENGVLIVDNGSMLVLAVSDTFECQVLWGNSDPASILKTVPPIELDLGLPDTNNYYANEHVLGIEACMFEVFDDLGFSHTHLTTFFEDSGGSSRPEYLRTFFYLKTLLEKICDKAGISYNIYNSDMDNIINNIVIGQTVSKTTRDYYEIQFVDIRNRTVRLIPSSTTPIYQIATGSVGVRTGFIDYSTNPTATSSEKTIFIPEDGLYNIDIIISYSQSGVNKSKNASVYFISRMPNQNSLAGDILPTDLSIYGIENAIFASGSVSGENVTDEKIEIRRKFFKKGFYGFIVFGQGNDSDYPSISNITFTFQNFKIDFHLWQHEKKEISVDYSFDYLLNNNIVFTNSLKAYDILVGIMQALGLFAQTNAGTTEFFTFKDLIDNIPNAYDWSSRLVRQKNGSFKKLEFDIGLGSNNLLQWKAEGQYLGTKDGSFEANSINPETKTYSVNSAFSQCGDYLFEKFPIANFLKRKENPIYPIEFESYDTFPKMFELTGETFQRTNITSIPGDCVSTDLFDYNNENGIRKYIQPLIDSLKEAKILTVLMYLYPEDVSNLDFKRPIYLQQFNSYYFLQKITAYEQGYACEVELLKLEF